MNKNKHSGSTWMNYGAIMNLARVRHSKKNDFTLADREVLIVLASYTSPNGYFELGHRKISEYIGLSQSTISVSSRKLHKFGAISILNSEGGRNFYRVHTKSHFDKNDPHIRKFRELGEVIDEIDLMASRVALGGDRSADHFCDESDRSTDHFFPNRSLYRSRTNTSFKIVSNRTNRSCEFEIHTDFSFAALNFNRLSKNRAEILSQGIAESDLSQITAFFKAMTDVQRFRLISDLMTLWPPKNKNVKIKSYDAVALTGLEAVGFEVASKALSFFVNEKLRMDTTDINGFWQLVAKHQNDFQAVFDALIIQWGQDASVIDEGEPQ